MRCWCASRRKYGRSVCGVTQLKRGAAGAVVAYSDDVAWGFMRALTDAGLVVPDDMSVVGYDASRLSRIMPRDLTSVRQDAPALAALAERFALVGCSRDTACRR